MNYFSRFSKHIYFFSTVLSVLFGTCLFSSSVYAGCSFQGADSGVASNDPFELRAVANQILKKKRWMDDRRYPVGSLMGVATVSVNALNCQSLSELLGHPISMVYEPPAGAVPRGSGYRVQVRGSVAVDIEFPNATPYLGGLLFFSSTGTVAAGGTLTSVRANWSPKTFPIKVTLVKTGPFGKDPGDGNINFAPGGLGTLRFHSKNTPSLTSSSITPVQLPAGFNPNHPTDDQRGLATAPKCDVKGIGNVSFVTGSRVFKLAAVNQNDFGKSVGAIDKSASSQKLEFGCEGTDDTKPAIYFDADRPFNSGVEGVGLPKSSTGKDRDDIGIQVLFNDVPVRFQQRSGVLGWTRTPYGPAPGKPGDNEQGKYCVGNCGTDMTGPNWIEGGVSFGTNDAFTSQVTFKYYQTTAKTPEPGTFSVPFTVTIELQ